MEKIKANVDMMISETKLDNTFRSGQFLIDGFNEPRQDISTKVLPIQELSGPYLEN